MKRAELLRQLDENVDRLEEEVAFAKAELHRIKTEESQRVPKWAMTINGTHTPSIIKNGKWYKIRNFNGKSFNFTGDGGNYVYCLVKGCAHLNGGDWELCYDDQPPAPLVEKKLDPAEILRQRANKFWSATVPGYKILYLRGDINSDNYVAILTDGTHGDNTFLLVGKDARSNMRDGVVFIGCLEGKNE